MLEVVEEVWKRGGGDVNGIPLKVKVALPDSPTSRLSKEEWNDYRMKCEKVDKKKNLNFLYESVTYLY